MPVEAVHKLVRCHTIGAQITLAIEAFGHRIAALALAGGATCWGQTVVATVVAAAAVATAAAVIVASLASANNQTANVVAAVVVAIVARQIAANDAGTICGHIGGTNDTAASAATTA